MVYKACSAFSEATIASKIIEVSVMVPKVDLRGLFCGRTTLLTGLGGDGSFQAGLGPGESHQ
jgi:hypothetical protein